MTDILREKVTDILDEDEEMHDMDCACVMGDPGPFPCDCEREEKIDKLIELIIYYHERRI